MEVKTIREIMVPVKEYAVVSHAATFYDAMKALDEAQYRVPAGRQPNRAVLVVDENNQFIGKIGQLAFLKALEPKYEMIGDLGKLSQVNLSSEFVASMMEHFRFFNDNLMVLCQRARTMKVKDIMHPLTDSIDIEAPLREAVSMIVLHQELSLLVTEKGKVVGLLRLSDVFDEISAITLAAEE